MQPSREGWFGLSGTLSRLRTIESNQTHLMEEDRNYSDECGDHGGTNRNGDPCGRAAGWGTEFDSGKCRIHRGTNADGSSHEGNDNASGNSGGAAPENNDNGADHELYSQSNAYYQRRSEDEQAIIDEFYEDYYDRYTTRHGEPPAGDKAMLFKVAVSLHKVVIKADEWQENKPPHLDAGNPLIDRSQKVAPNGESYYEFSVTAVDQAENRIWRRIRQWLKDNGLNAPSDDGADVEVNISQRMWDDQMEYYSNEGD